MADNIPPPPSGFQLEQPSVTPAPPAGYQLATPDDAMVEAAMQHQASLPENERERAYQALAPSMQQAITAKIHADAQAAMTPQAKQQRLQQINAQNVADQNPLLTGLQGFGQSFVNAGRGIGEALGIESPKQVEDARKMDEALSDSRAGTVGNLIGQGAQVIGTAALGGVVGGAAKALPYASDAIDAMRGVVAAAPRTATAAALAAPGAAYGYLSPYATEGEHAANTAIGVAAGPALAGAGRLGLLAGRIGKLLFDRYARPGAAADRIIAAKFANDPLAAGDIRAGLSRAQLAGDQPTLAQVAQNPAAVQVERSVRSNPETAAELVARDNANNANRIGILNNYAGREVVGSRIGPDHVDLDAREAAAMTRGANLGNFMDGHVPSSGLIDADAIRTTLAPLTSSGNPTVQAAASHLHALLNAKELADSQGNGFISPESADDLRQNIGNVIRKAANDAGDHKQGAAQAHLKLAPVNDAIIDQMEAIAPGYRNAVQNYARQSVPVNTADAVRDFLNGQARRAPNASGADQLSPSQLWSFIERDGGSPYRIDPNAIADARAVHANARDAQVAQSKIGASGSNTDADLQNRLVKGALRHGSFAGAGAIGGAFGGGPVGSALGVGAGLGIDALDAVAQRRIAQALGERVLNPALAARAIDRRVNALGRLRRFNQLVIPTSQYGALGIVGTRRAGAGVGVGQ